LNPERGLIEVAAGKFRAFRPVCRHAENGGSRGPRAFGMPKGQLYHLLGFLRRLASPLSGEPDTDGELLQRVLNQSDELAFQMLMQRHGPMVLATCQRVLHDADEAEDAFQATFLVLAQKGRLKCVL